MYVVQPLLDIPPTCEREHSVACAAVYHWTHNEALAHASAWAIGKPLAIIGLLVLAWVSRWIAHRVIDRLVRRAENGLLPGRLSGATGAGRAGTQRRVQRAKGLGSLLHSISSGLILGIVGMMILSQVDVNIAPILASAGVVGVAIGFGAQSLVKDFLSGIALMVEDQYGIGDVVNLGTVSGTVEAIGLRVTRLRDVEGTVWYVRNGEILSVGNMSQNWARAVLDVSVGLAEDIPRVRAVLNDLAHDLWQDEDFEGRIIEEPEVWGVQEISNEAVTVRVVIKTAPMDQWAVGREMRQRIVARFRHEEISMPRSALIRDVSAGSPNDLLPTEASDEA